MVEPWVDVGPAAALERDGRIDGEVDGFYVAIVRVAGQLYAFEDRCTHDGGSLAEAEVCLDETTGCGVVICPRHGSRFCLATGEAMTPPAYEPLRRFEARMTGERIEVRVP
jgi:3-phenylpropionate/trans-cinnamate dioxygenase ferredoxin subunit